MKKKVLFLCFFVSLFLCLLIWIQTATSCYTFDWCKNLWGGMTLVGILLIPFVPAFFFSLITYFLKERVFRTWFYFACVWIPLSMMTILIVPDGYGGLFVGAFGKQDIAWFLSAIFSLISLCIILIQSWRLRGK